MNASTERYIVAAILAIVLSFMASCHYSNTVVPMKMAERGYCWETTLVPAVPGYQGTSYSGYRPCSPDAATK